MEKSKKANGMLKYRLQFGDVSVDGRIILKLILKKQRVML
jgi:hypothetical protein